jgi:hypothetical protein
MGLRENEGACRWRSAVLFFCALLFLHPAYSVARIWILLYRQQGCPRKLLPGGWCCFPVAIGVWTICAVQFRHYRRLRRQRLARQNHLCPACGYSVRALPEPRCPECGRTFVPQEVGLCPREFGALDEPSAIPVVPPAPRGAVCRPSLKSNLCPRPWVWQIVVLSICLVGIVYDSLWWLRLDRIVAEAGTSTLDLIIASKWYYLLRGAVILGLFAVACSMMYEMAHPHDRPHARG